MSDAAFATYFWPAFFGFLGVLVVQIPIIIAAIKTNRKLDDVKSTALATSTALTKQGTALTAQVGALSDQLTTMQLTKREVELIMKGREREIMVEGIERGKQQATDFGALGKQNTDFNPLGK